MNLSQSKYYFIGIGGIGMSAIARWLWSIGAQVSGYDRTPSIITDELINSGIEISFDDSPDQIPDWIKQDSRGCIVVKTPAVPEYHRGLTWLKINGYRIVKRAEFLGTITSSYTTIAVAGTHGKTTTSSILTWILHDSGIPCGAFLGGISSNLKSNMLAPPFEGCPVVVEADEYDRSFLHLNPKSAILTSMDSDHLDIYGSDTEVKNSFIEFTKRISPDGILIYSDKCALPEGSTCKKLSYSLTENTPINASIKGIENYNTIFDYHSENISIPDIKLPIPGIHNVENTCAAISMALLYGCSADQIKNALLKFKGISRRFELIGQNERYILYDDYAHHPTEIKAFIQSVRYLHPEKYITLIFQPHLFSRTKDFAQDFANELDKADEIILLEIYPARETPIPGVNSAMLTKLMKNKNVRVFTKESMLSNDLKFHKGVIATVGAGDIDRLIIPLKNYLNVT